MCVNNGEMGRTEEKYVRNVVVGCVMNEMSLREQGNVWSSDSDGITTMMTMTMINTLMVHTTYIPVNPVYLQVLLWVYLSHYRDHISPLYT